MQVYRSGSTNTPRAALICTVLAVSIACTVRAFEPSAVRATTVRGAPITPDRLDQILASTKAGSLTELLSTPEKRAPYMRAIMELHGNKVTEKNFEWVSNDVLRVSQLEGSEEFLSRAWHRGDYGRPFQLVAVRRTMAAVQEGATLASASQQLAANIRAQAAAMNEESVRVVIKDLENRFVPVSAAFAEGKKKGSQAQTAYFKYVRSSDQALAAAAWLFRESLRGDAFPRAAIDSTRKMNASSLVRSLLAHLGAYAKQQNLEFEGLGDLAKALLPETLRSALDNSFDDPDQVFEFLPTSRALHTFWKGIPCDECVGGERQDSVTSERWATSALSGTHFYFVYVSERGAPKRYAGFVEIVPFRRSSDDRIFGSVHSGCPDLAGTFTFLRPSGHSVRATAMEAFLLAAQDTLPNGWTGFIKSNARAMNDDGVAMKLLNSQAYSKGYSIGGPISVAHLNPNLARFLIGAGSSRGSGQKYGGNMITDATVRAPLGWGATEIRVLDLGQIPVDQTLLTTTETSAVVGALRQ